ncbi:hypothetical protein GCM10010222_22980 [Streptomyces tanashiensis]|uniref:hypothetical protein n=1 Tax=Streptomyces tanashiensis TaxID=67367 RepID=UPI00167B3523|nr:hypothetical protein [Streptomyces tanashiensis]GGS81093.1 hypothetical protein GCM10010222_22980 [Streptomyces tanashiensis]
MSVTKPTNSQTHQAGRHLAVAEALLRGLPAKPRGAQTYIEVGEHVAQVMVAAKGAWIIADIDKFTALTCDRVVLVNVTDGRDFYIADGDKLRAEVRTRHREFLERVGGTRPRNPDSRNTVIQPEHVTEWRDRWELFT